MEAPVEGAIASVSIPPLNIITNLEEGHVLIHIVDLPDDSGRKHLGIHHPLHQLVQRLSPAVGAVALRPVELPSRLGTCNAMGPLNPNFAYRSDLGQDSRPLMYTTIGNAPNPALAICTEDSLQPLPC